MEQVPSGRSRWMRSKPTRTLIAALMCAVLVFSFSGAVVFPYSVLIVDGDETTVALTSVDHPQALLQSKNISVGPYDAILYEETGYNERVLTIQRASLVTITADGTTKGIYRTGGNVADALAALGITLGDSDRINVSLEKPITGEMNIVIQRVTTRTITRESAIPFSVTELPTQTLKKGKTRTLSKGQDGVLAETVEQVLVDGVVTEETVLSEEILREPVAARVFVGDPDAPVSELVSETPITLDENGNPVSYKYKVTGKATAYSALGKPTKLKPGAVAMNLADFPRYTKLYIKTPDGSFTYGYAEVRDTGTAVREGICLVDLFFDSYLESCLFGAKTVDIYVLE